jgi:hypothetical protein
MVQHNSTRTQHEIMIQALSMYCPFHQWIALVDGRRCRWASNGVSQLQGVAVKEPIRSQTISRRPPPSPPLASLWLYLPIRASSPSHPPLADLHRVRSVHTWCRPSHPLHCLGATSLRSTEYELQNAESYVLRSTARGSHHFHKDSDMDGLT